jgi:hypothetical protein
MIDAARQDDQIALFKPNPDPVIPLAADVKVARTIQDVPNLLVLVQVLTEESLHFFLVNVAHLLGTYGNLIPVLVVARCSNLINAGDFGYAVVDDT